MITYSIGFSQYTNGISHNIISYSGLIYLSKNRDDFLACSGANPEIIRFGAIKYFGVQTFFMIN